MWPHSFSRARVERPSTRGQAWSKRCVWCGEFTKRQHCRGCKKSLHLRCENEWFETEIHHL